MATTTRATRTRQSSRMPTRRTAPPRPTPQPVEEQPDSEPVEEQTAALAAPRRPRVMIDGAEYVPAINDSGLPRVGLAITTHNRNDLLDQCLAAWREHTPADWPILVIDDASDKPVDGADYRFDRQAGVPVAKNKSLELLMGHPDRPEHLFLLDDDIYPRVDEWWKPYLESPEPHLAHSWNLSKVWEDDRHIAWHASGGTLLYYTRAVIADVGGMRTDFGPDGEPSWGCEHVNLSDRIFNRGHTSWRYADVQGAERLFRELDRDRQQTGHKSTATPSQREHNRTDGRELWQARIETDDAYVEYRTDADVLLTCLFTNKQAQLSGRKLTPSVEPLRTLADSIQHGRLVCFYDRMENPELQTGNGRPVEFVPAECKINIFFQRWLTYWQWLREHPEIARVWCVDGTDVTQLRDPFTPLQPGKIHVGWEPHTQTNRWMNEHHPERRYRETIAAHPGELLLNAGLVGGDRATVMAFIHDLIGYFFDVKIDNVQVWQPRTQATVGPGDMGGFQVVGYSDQWRDKIITGPAIATVFKQFEKDNESALFQHK